MRHIIYIFFVVAFLIFSCGTQHKTVASADGEITKEEPVRIANDSLEYEVTIIDPGFNAFLHRNARPMNYYSQEFLELRNRIYVIEWNNRVRQPSRFNPNIYENIIDYQPNVDYGMEVNYKLFWYFQFAQRKYNMRLGSFRVYGT